MCSIRIIPVLDVKNLEVVQAISGQREIYKPMYDSRVIANPSIELALISFRNLGFREIYIADIDSIEEYHNIDFVKRYIEFLDMYDRVYIDIGRRGLQIEHMYRNIIPVIGTEYISSNEIYLLDRRTISMDMFGNYVKFRDRYVNYIDFLHILHTYNIVPERVLILDLERVGTLSGIDIEKVRNIVLKLRQINVEDIIYGGGVRDFEDLDKLCSIGINGVIVGTAIHKGLI